MSSIGVLTKRTRPCGIFRAPILGLACAIALALAICRPRVSAAADASGAAAASPASSPAASVSPAAPIAAASVPAAAITPAAVSSAVGGVSSYVADSTAPAILASPVSSPVADLDADAPDPADTPIATIPLNLLKTLPDPNAVPSTTVEIAPAVSEPQAAPSPPVIQEDSSSFVNSPEVVDYEKHQQDATFPGAFGPSSMQMSALSGDAITTPIGLELREARRTLKSGEEADGLLITEVTKGSPAAIAGLRAYSRGVHNALTGAMIAAALVFPPAIIGVPLLDYTEIGESYDLIIGVDGVRVTDFLDFQDRMRDLKPGEIVYLSVVRDGRRHQFRVNVPLGTNLAAW
jgi:hypothetical protein